MDGLCVDRLLQRIDEGGKVTQPQFAAAIDPPKVEPRVMPATHAAGITLLKRDVLAHPTEPSEID